MKLSVFLGIALFALSSTFSANSGTINNNSVWLIDNSHKDIQCLAQNIYFEARSDLTAGQFAVADVVLNRVRDSRWPDNVCDVVYQGPISKWHLENTGNEVPIRHQCQFSWYCDGKSDEPTDREAWISAQTIAYQIIYHDIFRGITEGATHYHATYVNPSWNLTYHRVGQIGAHIFYRAD